ncbi:MAG: MurR/RpiR family transcriptional regulator [Coprobacillaceae bacterium]
MGNNKIPAVFSYIASRRNDLTVRENEIANFVLKNSDFIVNNTITNIASEIGVSETSINRFCKKIGYRGFQDFKIALVQGSFYREINADQTNAPQSMFTSMLADYKEVLDSTVSMMKEEDFMAIVEYIRNSNHIYIFDNHSSLKIGENLRSKLKTIGIDSIIISDWSSMRLYCSKCQKDDVFFTFFNTMYSTAMIDALSQVSQKEGKNIVMTSYDSQKVSEIAAVKIVSADKLYIKNKDALSEQIAFVLIIDLLFSHLLLEEDYMQEKKNSDHIAETEQIANSYYFSM